MMSPGATGEGILQRLDDAQLGLTSLLSDLLNTGVATPAALIDAIGLEALERYLPSLLRVRMLSFALQEGRAGRPFDDDALLSAVSPAMLAVHLPLSVLRVALERLCPAPLSASPPHASDPDPLDESDEVTVAIGESETEALLAGMPDLTLTGSYPSRG